MNNFGRINYQYFLDQVKDIENSDIKKLYKEGRLKNYRQYRNLSTRFVNDHT